MGKKWFNGILSMCLSAILVVLLICTTNSNLFITNTLCLWGLAAIYLSLFIYYFFIPQLKKIKINIFIISSMISLIFLMVLPIRYGHVLTQNYQEKKWITNNTIEIIPLAETNENSTSSEIWIDKILVNYKDYDVNKIPLSEGWQILDGHIYTADAQSADKLEVQLPENSKYEVFVIETEASGMIEYNVGDCVQKLDLYSKDRTSVSIDFMNIWGEVLQAPKSMRCLYYFACYCVIYILVEGILQVVYRRYYEKKSIIDNSHSI